MHTYTRDTHTETYKQRYTQTHKHADTQTHRHTQAHADTHRPHEELNKFLECKVHHVSPEYRATPFPRQRVSPLHTSGPGQVPSTPPASRQGLRLRGADHKAPGPGTPAPTAPALRPNPPQYCQISEPVQDQNLRHTSQACRKHPRVTHSSVQIKNASVTELNSHQHTGPDIRAGAVLGQGIWVGFGPTIHTVTHDKTKRPALVTAWWEKD